MTNFESIIHGIIELSKLSRSEALTNNEIIIEGGKSGFFSSKTYKLTISKSNDD
jgi:hypothetical protein